MLTSPFLLKSLTRLTTTSSSVSTSSSHKLSCIVYFSSQKKKERAKQFALKQQQLLKHRQSSSDHDISNSNDPSRPDFNTILRQLYRRSHPDLLRHSHPSLADNNDQSMQILNGILTTIKTTGYPPQIIKDIVFHLKTTTITTASNSISTEGNTTSSGTSTSTVMPYVLSIRTGGGDCKRQLTTTFEQFFIRTGLMTGEKFIWNKEYFPIAVDNGLHGEQKTSNEEEYDHM